MSRAGRTKPRREPAAPRRAGGGYGELLRSNRPFRNLWFAQIVSLFGDWFNLIASAALLSALTGTGVALGGLIAIRMLAPFLASPIAGVLGDRYNRKRILLATDLLRAAVVLGFLFVREPGHVWLLFALTALQLGVSGLFFPIRQAILPDIVDRRHIGAANALGSATWSVMLAVGAAAGGLFAGIMGVYPAFLLDSATFLLSAAFLLLVRYEPPARTERKEGTERTERAPAATLVSPPGTRRRGAGSALTAAARDYLDGLRYLTNAPPVLVLAAQKSLLTFFTFSSFQVIAVAITSSVFVIGEGGGIALGLILGAGGVGSGIGPIVARAITGDRQRPQRVAILFGYLAAAAGMGLAGPLLSFGAVLAGATLRGIGAGIVWVFTSQLLLECAPERLRTRVFAAEHAGLTLFGAAGAAGAGVGLELAPSIAPVLIGLAALTVLPAIGWALLGLREQPAAELASPPQPSPQPQPSPASSPGEKD